MELKDIIPGEYYSTTCNLGGYAVILVSNKGENNYDVFISDYKKFYSKNDNWNSSIIKDNLKLASLLEKAWLQECVKQDKFVPLENIKLPQIDWLWTI